MFRLAKSTSFWWMNRERSWNKKRYNGQNRNGFCGVCARNGTLFRKLETKAAAL